jgi:hypothetical protein
MDERLVERPPAALRPAPYTRSAAERFISPAEDIEASSCDGSLSSD